MAAVDIRDLDYFLACCEAGSFTAAARHAHIVQSAMSSAIARLERELGVPLFDRSVTPIALTEHGAALQAGAQRILEAVQAARDDVAAVSGQVRGTVTLACTLNTGTLDLADVLARIRDRHPGVIVKLRQSSSGSAGNLQAVRDGSVDIALCASGGNSSRQRLLAWRRPLPTCGASRWSSCAARTMRSPGGTRSPPPILGEEMILRFPPGWGVRAIVDGALGDTQSAFEIIDYTLMMRLVRAGIRDHSRAGFGRAGRAGRGPARHRGR